MRGLWITSRKAVSAASMRNTQPPSTRSSFLGLSLLFPGDIFSESKSMASVCLISLQIVSELIGSIASHWIPPNSIQFHLTSLVWSGCIVFGTRGDLGKIVNNLWIDLAVPVTVMNFFLFFKTSEFYETLKPIDIVSLSRKSNSSWEELLEEISQKNSEKDFKIKFLTNSQYWH